ncbi:EAL domain-containing protein [Sulfitobacter sp. SK012]|uniref:EAL domain-containing protein n=1 Tax=Sulfitobacter sp. SK012 TaxID=1389005 RepID=UPI0020C76115|nr:EAL domain-containing protein [Sulfitobacter sp. SK012]
MARPFHYKRVPVISGSDNPLNYAVGQIEKTTLECVADAIKHKQTLLAYQPVMRTDNQKVVAFYEGLIRVLDPSGRVIPAKDFMPEVENTEAGREIDVLALRMGLRALNNNPNLRLSINMSARSIGYQPWNNTLNRALNRNTAIGERLILEITESSAMHVPELVVDFMDRLQPKGICFAMDDFGSGQTAIRYFKDFLFDMLKIDGQFIQGIAGNPDNQALTKALISIAQHFDMLTVAECVECHEDAVMLTELGVDCLQGYFFAAPTTRPSWMRDTSMRAAGQ